MRTNYIRKNILFFLPFLLMAFFLSCTYDTTELGPKPVASFTVTPITGQTNKYLLTSTSQNAFRFDWDKANGAGYVKGRAVDTVYFPDAGTYKIKLFAFGQSGIDSASQNITVAADDPAALTPLKILSGNSTKTWILEQPAGGGLWVGPNDPGAGAWWSNSAGDVLAPDRTCLFNDEYTFKKTGEFIFNDKGDFRVDDEGGNPWPTNIGLAIGCYSTSAIPAQFQAWGSGNFTFAVIGNNQLRVIGNGGHLGLYKVGETGTSAAPEPMITYDILELTPTKLVVRKQYGWGQWRFTFRVKT